MNTAPSPTSASQVATCLVSEAKGSAGSLVGGPMTSDPSYQTLTQALTGKFKQCAPGAKIPLGFISGALAEELVRRDRPALQDRISRAEAASADSFSNPGASGETIGSLGRCLAAYSPGLAYRVVASAANSAGETQALATLYAKTPECGQPAPPAGFSESEQRSSVASGLYLWIHRS